MYAMSVLACCALVVSGCGTPSALRQNDAPAEETRTITVVASFFPLAKITETVGGDAVHVETLAGEQDVHDYAPSPQDMRKMWDADLIVLLGSVEPWASEVVPQLRHAGKSVVVISEHIPFETVATAHDDDAHKHADKHSHGDKHDHDADHAHGAADHDGHHHDGTDPHIWLDPVRASTITAVIAGALKQTDPARATTFHSNAAVLESALADVDVTYSTQLGSCTRRSAIVSHEAFGYVARRYNITLTPIVGLSTMDEPSAQLLAELQTVARHDGITHVLAEQNTVQRFAQTIAQSDGLTLTPIDTLEFSTTHNAQRTYPDLLLENLHAIATALGCENAPVVQ